MTLYFSSNRKGGYGGLDIYSAQMDSRGRFGKVRNLGPDINTAGDELFPYVSDNGKLYFSSDGQPGYGMMDIFVVNQNVVHLHTMISLPITKGINALHYPETASHVAPIRSPYH